MDFINIVKNNFLTKNLKAIRFRLFSIKNLQPTTYNLQPNRGFTLLESLVAISILMIAVASPLTIAQKGLSSAFHAKDQIVASYLAQDAIEYIINWSDQNVAIKTGWLDTIKVQCTTLCTVDTRESYPNALAIQNCTDTSPADGICDNKPLLYDDSVKRIYSYILGDPLSPFTRSVKVEETSLGVDALITVKVSWNDKGTLTSLEFNTRIFNWK